MMKDVLTVTSNGLSRKADNGCLWGDGMKKSFDEVFEDRTKYGTKIKTDDYHTSGTHIIIDQGQEQIAGYTDLEEGLFTEVPAIIFGDHTRIIKYVDRPFFLGADGVKVLRCRYEDANYKYLYYALKSVRVPNTGYNRHFKWLKEATISYPDINVQEKIVEALEKASGIMDKRRQQLSALDNLIKARFIEMFGDPVSNPMRWETVMLEDCLERIDNGKSFVCSDKPRTGNDPAVLKLSAATYGDYRPQENKALLDANQFIEAAEVHSGDLLFTRKNTPELVGMAAYVSRTPPKLMMPDLIFRLVPNEKINPVYLWQLINCREFRPVIQAISGGSAKSMSNISKERLGRISVICPPRAEQDKLTPIIQQIDKSKSVIQKSLDETQLLFDSLMQKYFG